MLGMKGVFIIESQWDKEASKYEHGTGIAENKMAE